MTADPGAEGTGSGRIVVGVDGSSPSDAALRWGLAEAVLRSAPMVAVHVQPVASLPGLGPSDAARPLPHQADVHRRDGVLLEALDRVGTAHDRVDLVHAEGAPSEELLREAARAELLVLGTRGRSALKGILLGSVSHACIQAAPCTVVLLRNSGQLGSDGPLVVGVDGSPGSVNALAWALAEANRRNAKVTAVLVWDDPYTVVGPPPALDALDETRLRLERVLQGTVDATRRLVPAADVATVLELRSGHPVEELVAASGDAGALVLGRRGGGRLAASIVGSVTYAAAHVAPAPLVIVTPPRATSA